MPLKRLSAVAWTAALSVALLTHSARAVSPLTTVRVASGLNRPVFVTSPPGDPNRLFIVEKAGVIKILNLNTGVVNGTPFLDINSIVGGGETNNSEQGLLGLAFHPSYTTDPNNRFFYVNYTNNSGNTVIARYTITANPDVANPASALTLQTIVQPETNHNGGCTLFGPDGMLYIGMGDGGGANDQHGANGNAQNTGTLLGKMLRLDVNIPAPYVPADNPYVGPGNPLDEIWQLGLRNPWRFSFDRATGDLYIADVGQATWEEIDYVPAGTGATRNFGWRCMEGNHCTGLSGCTCNINCTSGVLTCPIYEYDHTVGCSISGGYVYRGPAIPSLQGTYFFSDFCANRIWSFRVVGGAVTEFTDRTTELDPPGALEISSVVSFGEDDAGEMYIVEQGFGANVGEVFRIVPRCAIHFTDHPDSQDACEGQTVQISVAVADNDGAVTYKWFKNGSPFPGGTNNPVLTINNVTPADAGDYHCTASDSCDTLVSQTATLTVSPIPLGDIDADCDLDDTDADLLVGVLLGLDNDPGRVARSDVNGSGSSNGDDVQAFVDEIVP